MKIGVDLDHTILGFPAFFRDFINAMTAAGHKFYCTSGHSRESWPKYCQRLRTLGINPDLIDPSLLQRRGVRRGPEMKARMADQLDIVFDDDAEKFQALTKTPVLKTPRIRSTQAA